MFNFASGVRVPFPQKIEEKYAVYKKSIVFNISFEKLAPLIDDFLLNLSEPLFLFIHLPLRENEEKELRKNGTEPFHSEVLYLDGQIKNQIHELMEQFGDLLLNDGMSQFGIASHTTGDEIFIQKYKIVNIHSENIKQYFNLMDRYGITKTRKLITAWNTFTQEHPGECSKVTLNDKDVYYAVKMLKGRGMYRAKIVDD